jgi:hypothetical protein
LWERENSSFLIIEEFMAYNIGGPRGPSSHSSVKTPLIPPAAHRVSSQTNTASATWHPNIWSRVAAHLRPQKADPQFSKANLIPLLLNGDVDTLKTVANSNPAAFFQTIDNESLLSKLMMTFHSLRERGRFQDADNVMRSVYFLLSQGANTGVSSSWKAPLTAVTFAVKYHDRYSGLLDAVMNAAENQPGNPAYSQADATRRLPMKYAMDNFKHEGDRHVPLALLRKGAAVPLPENTPSKFSKYVHGTDANSASYEFKTLYFTALKNAQAAQRLQDQKNDLRGPYMRG